MSENCGEQLEEGEIVDDDDDFEDISDNSIIDLAFGKFVSTNENLRALSLSSDSETDRIKQIRYKRKVLHRKSRIKQRKRKHLRLPSDSSDSDTSPLNDLKGKLKEAIHISGVEGNHKNTLESRLKAMGGLLVNTEPATEPLPETANVEDNSDKNDDTELENLRLEALKTAVLNKCQRRKRKKALLEAQEAGAPLKTLEDKENNTPKDEQDGKNNQVTNDAEEDEDVLRASLLAGLAKKIAKKPTPTLVQFKQVPPKLPISVVSLPKQPINKFKTNTLNKRVINKQIVNNKIVQNRPKPQVKPLIINVNGDSDSEEDLRPQPIPQPSRLTDVNAIENNVERFLKEQRAKFETESKNKLVPNKDKTILEKSAVKLLPKSQQIEYHQLLKRLRNAERRKKAKKIALQNNKTKIVSEPIVIKENKLESALSPKDVEKEASKSDNSCTEEQIKSEKTSDTGSEGRRSGIINELTTLQRTLKEIKMQRNGSLQIKSKYQMLTPIIRKITATSNDRKKQEHRIKTLLQELSEARSNLAKSHERFSTLVRELVARKEKIDKRLVKSTRPSPKCQCSLFIPRNFSTRLFSSCQENGKIATGDKKQTETKKAPVTSTPVKPQLEVSDETTISTFVTSSTNHEYEDMDVCNSDETDICIDIVDPNDIDQIFKRRPPVKSTLPEYISPLNYNAYERYRNVDPLGIMCPYEVNGSCRDIDCTYKHYLKSHERL